MLIVKKIIPNVMDYLLVRAYRISFLLAKKLNIKSKY